MNTKKINYIDKYVNIHNFLSTLAYYNLYFRMLWSSESWFGYYRSMVNILHILVHLPYLVKDWSKFVQAILLRQKTRKVRWLKTEYGHITRNLGFPFSASRETMRITQTNCRCLLLQAKYSWLQRQLNWAKPVQKYRKFLDAYRF